MLSAGSAAPRNAFGIAYVPSLFLVEVDGTISLAAEGFLKTDLEAIGARAGVPLFRVDEAVPGGRPVEARKHVNMNHTTRLSLSTQSRNVLFSAK